MGHSESGLCSTQSLWVGKNETHRQIGRSNGSNSLGLSGCVVEVGKTNGRVPNLAKVYLDLSRFLRIHWDIIRFG